MKKVLLSCLLMLLPILASSETVEIGGIYYNLIDSKTAEVTRNPNKYSGDIIIPESIDHNGSTYTVISIGFHAFMDCSVLSSVSIPNSVTSIDAGAFKNCIALTSVTIP